MKKQFYKTCDKFRSTITGENFWQEMMENKVLISEKKFVKLVDFSRLLDYNEKWEDYREGLSDIITFYSYKNVLFFQTCGFEFIFK